MSFNLYLQEKCNRKRRMARNASDKFVSMLEPFVLENHYPGTPTETFPGSGRWKEVHTIQPHQQKLHDRISLSGRKPKHLLFTSGVGAGKTLCLCVEMYRLLRTYPGIKIVCADGDTLIDGVPMGDRVEPEYVSTIHGQSIASAPFQRGQADLWRVQTRSGRSISVTEHHRFLTLSGWRPLADLRAGDAIACDGKPGEWHGSEKSIGSAGSYRTGLRSGDELLSPEAVAALYIVRRLLDLCRLGRNSLPCTSSSLPLGLRSEFDFSGEYPAGSGFDGPFDGVLEDREQYRRSSRLTDSELQYRLSEVLSGLSSLPHDLACTCLEVCSILCPDLCREFEPLSAGFGAAGSPGTLSQDRICAALSKALKECRTYASVSRCAADLLRASGQFSPDCLLQRTLAAVILQLSLCYPPFDNDDTSFWDEITSISYNKFGDYFDLSVASGFNYSGNGIYSHNCVTAYDYYFDEFLMPVWEGVLPDDSPHIKRYNRKSRTIILTNGSSIRFKAYEDHNRIKGWQAHVIWIEEGSSLGGGNSDKAYQIWNALLMRLRAARPKYDLRTYVTQNPNGHNWLWKIFIKDEPGKRQPLGDVGKDTIYGHHSNGEPKYFTEWEKVTDKGEVFYTITTPSTSNDFLPEGYVDSMLSGMVDDPGLRQRMVEGKFNPVNTLVYDFPIYSERTHLIDYYRFLEQWDIDEIPKWWRVVVGIDVGGTRSPWAVEFYVQTEDGHWVCFDEIYQPNLVYDEICDRIKRKSEGFEDISYWIDPISSQHKGGATLIKLQEEFKARGLGVRPPKGYNKMGGIARVQNFLKRDHAIPCPYKDDILNEDEEGNPFWEIGHAQLYYMTNMPNRKSERNPEGHSAPGNIKEKGVYRWDQTKQHAAKETEEGLSPMLSSKLIDRDDHAQTAEMFFALGVAPVTSTPKSEITARKRNTTDSAKQTPIMYGRAPRTRRTG